MPVNRLTIESATETTTHQGAGVSVSGITGDYTIKLLVTATTAEARIVIEESSDGVNWKPLSIWNFAPGTLPVEGEMVSFRKRQAAGTDLAGTDGAELRLNLLELNPVYELSPSITYDAWVEY